jgi:Flp pilus assembly protein TadG
VLVEFALVITIFVTLLLGAIDLSRWLYAIDAANEATRQGARTAVVCARNAAAVTDSMLPALITATGGTTSVNYLPSNSCCAVQSSSCTACTGVVISLNNYRVPRIAPFLPTMNLPPVTTYLPRESMDSTNNPRCS